MTHVFSWVAGFGWTLMPQTPVRFERLPGPDRGVRLRHTGPDGAREALVTVSDEGTPRVELGPGVGRADEVLDLILGAAYEHWTTGAAYDHWRIETYPYTVRWPEGFAVEAPGVTGQPAFDLVGPDDARLWIQGPIPEARLPPPDRMGGPGQRPERITECAGGPLVELVYEHAGVPWRMFHCIVDRNAPQERGLLSFLRKAPPRYVCVVTAQTPEPHADLVRGAVEEVAASLTPCPGDDGP